MNQISLATTGFEFVTKRMRKREFLDEMNLMISWSQLLSLITPHAPAGKTGRPPFATEVMLRIRLLRQFLGHSDPAIEEALHDTPLYREFATRTAHWAMWSHLQNPCDPHECWRSGVIPNVQNSQIHIQ
jgi:transposase, IS5 family